MYQPDFPTVPFRLGLYPVVDSVEWIARLLEAGVRTLQLRIKDKRDEEVEADVIAAIALGRRYHARLFINDYWRLAVKHQRVRGASGTGRSGNHRSQRDPVTPVCGWAFLPTMIWRSTWRWRPAPLTSRSGHVFPTQTKQMPSAPQGLTQLAAHVKRLADYPTVAIGGISLERAPDGAGDRRRQYRRRQRYHPGGRLAVPPPRSCLQLAGVR